MDEAERIKKNDTISEKGKATRERHAMMRPFVVELKLDMKCLNKEEQKKILMYFVQCRWLCNWLLSLSDEEFWSFDKDGNRVERHLTMLCRFLHNMVI